MSVFLIFFASIAKSGKILDTDIFWQVRAGLDWFNNFKIITIDQWSYIPAGDWIPNSWGWNIVLATFFKISPEFGLFFFGSLLNLFLFFILIRMARKLNAKWEYINISLILIIIFALPIFAIRPAFISGLTALLFLIYSNIFFEFTSRSPIIAYLTFFFFNILMINFHYSWPAFILPSLIGITFFNLNNSQSPKLKINSFALLFLISILGIFINPLGIHLFKHIFETVSVSKVTIYEWQFIGKEPMYIISLIIALLPIWFMRFENNSKLLSGAVITFSLMGLYAIRFIPWALVYSFPLIAIIPNQFKVPTWWQNRHSLITNLVSITFVLIFIPFSYEGIKYHGKANNLEMINKLPTKCQLFASPLISGEVILYRPDIKIYIDGRNDYWGIDRYKFANALIENPTLKNIDAIGTTCILTEAYSPLSKLLNSTQSWKRTNKSNLEIWINQTL